MIKKEGSVEDLDNKEKLIVLIGPTAVGKTKLSIELAKRFHCEIISGDSMQIYKGLDIGTAKISPPEMEGIPHHLIDIKEPHESFSVFEFQQLVRKKITEISSRGKLPMIVGGTGFYIQSVIYDYRFSDAPSDENFRKKLERRAEIEGKEALYQELAEIDPEAAGKIHPNNLRRVIRALEIYHCTGKPMSYFRKNLKQKLSYDTAVIGLTMERQQLYERINKRVDLMLEKGLLDEVKALHDSGLRDCQSIQAIGYKELYKYLDGMCTFEEAVEELKRNSRNYAKRQLTWFRNQMEVKWFDMTEAVTEEGWQKKVGEISMYIEGKLKIKANTYYVEINEED